MNLRRLAREHPGPISAELFKMADEIAAEASALEAELLGEGLLDAGLKPANQR
jgi:hypothetical protein